MANSVTDSFPYFFKRCAKFWSGNELWSDDQQLKISLRRLFLDSAMFSIKPMLQPISTASRCGTGERLSRYLVRVWWDKSERILRTEFHDMLSSCSSEASCNKHDRYKAFEYLRNNLKTNLGPCHSSLKRKISLCFSNLTRSVQLAWQVLGCAIRGQEVTKEFSNYMAANYSLSQHKQKSVQIHTEKRRGENCSLTNTNLDTQKSLSEFHLYVGLIPIHLHKKPEGQFWVFKLLEKSIKVKLIKFIRQI